MRVLTFVPVQGVNFSFQATLLQKQGLVFGGQEYGGQWYPTMRTFWRRCEILTLLKMLDEHDVAVSLFDLGEKEPMLVRRNR